MKKKYIVIFSVTRNMFEIDEIQDGRKSMFWPLILYQAMNTHFLSTLQWHAVLTLSIFQSRTILYHRPQGCSTPGQISLLWRKLNVLVPSTGSNQN